MQGIGEAVRNNDIETAIKGFRNKTRRDGLLKELDIRAKNPNQGDRKKAKARKAVARRRKRLAKMGK